MRFARKMNESRCIQFHLLQLLNILSLRAGVHQGPGSSIPIVFLKTRFILDCQCMCLHVCICRYIFVETNSCKVLHHTWCEESANCLTWHWIGEKGGLGCARETEKQTLRDGEIHRCMNRKTDTENAEANEARLSSGCLRTLGQALLV